jgi:thiazolylpeptide-type bacteriocin precursor
VVNNIIEKGYEMNSILSHDAAPGTAVDLQDLEIETFEIETLSELGVTAALAEEAAALDLTVSTTSSTTSSSCG